MIDAGPRKVEGAAASDAEARRRARRAVAWQHHPDRGGSATDFVAELAALADSGSHRGFTQPPVTVRRTRGMRLRRGLHRWRQRRMSRHYFTLS